MKTRIIMKILISILFLTINSHALALDSLSLSQGIIIQAITGKYASGVSAKSAGDINGDGIEDIIIGAPYANSHHGEVYIIYGGNNNETSRIDLNVPLSLEKGFTVFGGTENHFFGDYVSTAGDLNGDGIDDVIISDPYKTPGSGMVYVIYGNRHRKANINLSSGLNPTEGFSIVSNDEEILGLSVGYAGDINSDGLSDIFIGDSAYETIESSGKVYVVYGRNGGMDSVNASSLNSEQGFVISGEICLTKSRSVISGAGDVNADGIDDIIIAGKGKASLIFGRKGGIEDLVLESLSPSQGFTLTGAEKNGLDYSVGRAGDLNQDGIDDILIGDADEGKVYVIFGSKDIENLTLNGELEESQGYIISGEKGLGYIVQGAGNFNGDGLDDLLIGNYQEEAHKCGAYILYGKASNGNLLMSSLEPDEGMYFEGEVEYPWSKWTLSNAGDFNNDGIDDTLIETRGSGVYLIYGAASRLVHKQ